MIPRANITAWRTSAPWPDNAQVEQDLGPAAIVARGHDPAVVARVVGMIERNEYKRRQAPPGLRVTSRAFGMGRRVPIARRIAGTHPSAGTDETGA